MTRWFIVLLLAGAVALILLLTQVSSKETRVRGQVAAEDTDGDGWSDSYEFTYIGTTPWGGCSTAEVSGWPPDFDDSNFVDISDVVSILRFWENPVAPGFHDLQRFDIANPPLGDGYVDVTDIIAVTGRFATACVP